MKGMIRSMTGYGRGTSALEQGSVTVEIRSLNHRFLDVSVRGPRETMALEPEVRRRVRERLSRGKVDVFITLSLAQTDLQVDLAAARGILGGLQELASLVGDTVRLEHLLAAGELLRAGEGGLGEGAEAAALSSLEAALDQLVLHREGEGEVLRQDLLARLGTMQGFRESMAPLAASVPPRILEQLTRFLEKALPGELSDPARIHAEAALMAQKADVSEELTRLQAHLTAFGETLSQGGAVGRRLDFLLQEIQRETNTVGSKSGDDDLSGLVVDAKAEMEKMREQVQNIE